MTKKHRSTFRFLWVFVLVVVFLWPFSLNPGALAIQDQSRVVPTTIENVSVTNGTTLDVMIEEGFFLSGQVMTIDGQPVSDFIVFATPVTHQTGALLLDLIGATSLSESNGEDNLYNLLVPSGVYSLTVITALPLQEVDEAIAFIYPLPEPVEIFRDGQFDITVPVPASAMVEAFPVSLTVALPDDLFDLGIAMFVSDNGTIAGFGGFSEDTNQYTTFLPAGTYSTTLLFVNSAEIGAVFNFPLGSIEVSGPTETDLSFPGTHNLPVFVIDRAGFHLQFLMIASNFLTVPNGMTFGLGTPCALPLGLCLSLPSSLYDVSAIVPISLPDGMVQHIKFPAPPLRVNGRSDKEIGFIVPEPPRAFTLSGQVVNPRGIPAAGWQVVASTLDVTDAPGIRFVAITETDVFGRYSFSVLSGELYTLWFVPTESSPISAEMRPQSGVFSDLNLQSLDMAYRWLKHTVKNTAAWRRLIRNVQPALKESPGKLLTARDE